MDIQNNFTKALEFRHACKLFDTTKTIDDDAMHYILEAARLSPSSFGMEGWKFLVITNEKLKEKLQPLCWNQPQITTCSHLVVVLAAIDALKPQSGIPLKRFQRREMPQEKLDFYVDIYAKHLQDTLSNDENLFCWSARQTYIAATNMMMAAAYIGIDSCPIEGFEKENVEKVLDINTQEYQVALLLPFGYRVDQQPKKLRRDFEDVVEFIK